jgi:hypothetical protein
MVGPALAGILAVTVHPASALVLAAVLILVFGTLFAVHPTVPGPTPVAPGAGAGVRLWSPGLALVFTMAVLQGAAWSGANTGVNALAQSLGEPGTAGLVWAAMAVTSSIAGFVTVARPGSADLSVRLRWTVTAEALLTLPLLAVSGLWGATFAVAGIGLAVAPHLIALFGLVERVGPAQRMGEAMTVVGSGLILGQALAAAAAGPLADAFGHRAAFAVSCAATAVSAVLALTAGGRSRFGLPTPEPGRGRARTGARTEDRAKDPAKDPSEDPAKDPSEDPAPVTARSSWPPAPAPAPPRSSPEPPPVRR